MKTRALDRTRAGIGSVVLLGGILAVAGGLVALRTVAANGSGEAAAQPEPMEVITEAVATPREHRETTTSIGTVLATRSITLRNELPGTVRWARLTPGQIVGTGTVLVAMDVSVEEAELKALQARAELAETTLARLQRMAERRAVSAMELDNARAERDVARAEIERTRAIIARKTIRAPFRARVGIADVHAGQFLEAGTLLTTLQGVDDAANVDFAVAQSVAAGLRPNGRVDVFVAGKETAPIAARIVAVDARVDPTTRNATVRARVEGAGATLAPGASVRVRVPVGETQTAVVVPVSALRKGPGGDHVFVLGTENGQTRAQLRPVQTGPVLGDDVVILDGLQAGDRVAASGSFKLREGVLVHVSDDPTVTASAR